MTLTVAPKRVASVLASIALLLSILGISFTAYEWSLGVNNTYLAFQLSEIFSLNHEGNIPTWYAAMLLLSVSITSLLIAQATAFYERKGKWQWRALALLFFYLTLDESSALHESFTAPMREAFNLSGYLYFGWMLVGIPFVLIMALIFLPFVLNLPRHTKLTTVLAACIYLSGALGIESISANQWYLNDGTSLLYSGIGTIEEFMEMLGVIIMLYGLLTYYQREFGSLTISFISPPP